jgi:hypothetical protein
MIGENNCTSETDDQLMARGDEFLNHLKTAGYREPILVISHCDFIHSLSGESPQNAERIHLSI